MKDNNILLVYPGPFGSLFPELPLPLLYLSWALKKEGFNVEILDMRIKDYRQVGVSDYLFVGITSLTGPMIKEGLKFARYMRGVNENILIVWGGIHVSLLPEQSLSNPYVDIVVRGEGERTIQELAQCLKDNGDLSTIKGISYKKNNRIINNPDREFIDLNEIDIELPYELFEMGKYTFTAFPVHTSRGCPYRCGFCYNLAFNKRKWRHKNAERVLDEIEYATKKFGYNKISFSLEDEFFIDVERVRQVCEGILERGININWESFCRFDSFQKVDDELLKLMEKSGCELLSFGGESGSQRVLDEIIKKDIKVEYIINTTERLSKTNIKQNISFMSGLPNVTEEDMKLTFKLIDAIARINPSIIFNGILLYTPYPGTPLFEYISKQCAYKIPESLEKWAQFAAFRNVGITWHTHSYINKYKIISILTRFPFWKNNFSLADVKNVLGGSRFSKFPFSLFYYLLTKSAIIRWKYKFFKFPIEWWLLEKILNKTRGFV
jgi:radical SAM superfamily enzyme YgiQ (UPF0313 family)